MARKKRKQRASNNSIIERFVRPTPEREAHNDFQSAGAAMKIIPPIVRLHKAGTLSDEELEALSWYRDQACLADRSPMRSCIDFSPKGEHGPGLAIQSAIREVRRIESGLGPYLAALLRAVVRDDMRIEQWCAERNVEHGIVALELKYAAGGIVR